jgi:hypothetical protein
VPRRKKKKKRKKHGGGEAQASDVYIHLSQQLLWMPCAHARLAAEKLAALR